jgi:energy-coupling factor transporter ATP-binding protein EcfA2
MSDNSLQFTRLDIERMPGFKTGFTLDALGPGINVIYGPNASGKTTSVTALNAVLWPKLAPKRSEVSSWFLLGDESWLVTIFGDNRTFQRNGRPDDPPHLPPVEGCERYSLSLHSLLRADDASFAAAIARETAGGYDVAAAANAIAAQESATTRVVNETKEYTDAVRAVRDATLKQEELQTQGDELAELRKARQRALESGQQVERIVQAIGYLEVEKEFEDAQARLSVFPNEMGGILKTDVDHIAEMEASLEQEQGKFRDHQNAIDRAAKVMLDCALPDDGVRAGLLPTLREKGRKLGQIDEQTRVFERNLETAKAKVMEAQRHIGNVVDESLFKHIDLNGFGELASFARQAELFRIRRQGIDQAMRWFDTSDSVDNLEDLRQGRMLLTRWLRTEDARREAPGWIPWVLLATALVILVESVVLVASGLWPFLLGALFGSALAVTGVILLVITIREDRSPRQYLRHEFERLDLGQPRDWAEQEVLQKLDELDQRKADADIESERMKHRKDLVGEEQRIADQQKKIAQQRADLVQRFGIAPEAATDVDEAVLYLLAENVNRWQAAMQEGNAAHSEMSTARHQYEQKLDEINQELADYGYQPAVSVEEVLGHIEDLEMRNQQFARSQNQLENARQNSEAAVERITKLENDIGRFFAARGIEAGDKITLQLRVNCLTEYQEATKAVETAAFQLQQAHTAIESYPELAELSAEALKALLVEANETANLFEPVVEKISRIEERVKIAKAGSELGDALSHKEEAAEALRSRREIDYKAVTGGVLAAYVKQETSERTRPAVFRRARDLFARISHGKYELLLDESATGFRVIDNTTGAGHSLDELSSATRIQLLMAVRLAFVEKQEQGIKLPLFFDETLGNSDEERAEAIIQTAMEMARQGRQIFYFTAQLDEVEKWRGIISDGNGVETHFVDLAEARQLSRVERLPLPSKPVQRIEVPKPDGMDYYEYGTRLKVPGIDPSTTEIGGIHVWHVIEDGNTLYKVINNNIDSWGQLKAVSELSGLSMLGIEATDYERAVASAKAVEIAIQCWREGRGKRVDRQVLLDSGQVSGTHIDEVATLATNLGGDGLALIREIEAGQINRFWTSKREKLQEYLEEHGYIDRRDRLTEDEILLHVKLALAPKIQAGLITSARVDELVRRVTVFGRTED